MKLRGEFIRGDGLVIPNNVSLAGKQMMLTAALRNTVPAFSVGLVDAEPAAVVDLAGKEPSAAGGYARKPLTRDVAGWPGMGVLNGQPWLESDWLEWAAVGVKFDKIVRRLALIGAGDVVYALSGAMPEDLEITPTLEAQYRRFKYRIYGA